MKIKRALLSVWNKEGIIELGSFLSKNNIEILSTGGTKKVLEENNLDVTSISYLTGSGSIMDGRVKTLHPKVFGGILADRNNIEHLNDLESLHGLEIDLVVVNFYPFVKKAVKNKLDFKKAIEFIDIGGPSMIRSAAKNYHFVVPLCDPKQYENFMNLYSNSKGEISLDYRKKLAAKVFSMSVEYESAISNYFNKEDSLPENLNINLKKTADLRYGENPHQKAAFYTCPEKSFGWIQHQGKQLSFNNYADLESAYSISGEFSQPACTIIKHANPCGFGLGKDINIAYQRAVATDPISYFGGIVGFNKEVCANVAKELIQPFLECIIAPSISEDAKEILSKKKNLRVISVKKNYNKDLVSIKSVAGGYLFQNNDSMQNGMEDFKIVTKKKPTNDELLGMELGWKLVRYVKSNAIVIADQFQLLGVGAGQMSRIDSVKIAIQKVVDNKLNLQGSILASDAFFPFSDSLEIAAKSGVRAIIQPGGSIKDNDIIEKANLLDITMAFTKIRHFLH